MGLFVLSLALTFIGLVLWLGAGGSGRAYQTYLVYMRESVSGLSRDNVVKYQGVDVGRVREIGLDPDRAGEVRLVLQIERGTPVREDTVATLETQGLTGLAFINLTGGSVDSPLLVAQPGDVEPVIKSRRSTWGRLDRAVEELVANLIDVSKLLKEFLNEQNRLSLIRILNQIDRVTAELAGRSGHLGSAVDDLVATAANTRAASAGLPDVLDRFEKAAAALEQMANELRLSGASFGKAVQARDRDLQRFTGEALPEAAVMINELRHAAANLRRFSEQLERDPAVLLHGGAPRPPGPGE
jgi:phospholipid/cholesterol/gamma-HCH transport system substrate-binding protein